jgi:septal ring factor EnvC (AmiA/AmiB activator)
MFGLNFKIYIYLALTALVLAIGSFTYYKVTDLINQNNILKQEIHTYKNAIDIQKNTISQLEKSNKDWEIEYNKALKKIEESNKKLNDIEISVQTYKSNLKSLRPRGKNETDKERETIINLDYNNTIRMFNQTTRN